MYIADKNNTGKALCLLFLEESRTKKRKTETLLHTYMKNIINRIHIKNEVEESAAMLKTGIYNTYNMWVYPSIV
jgi:hypothetical protein